MESKLQNYIEKTDQYIKSFIYMLSPLYREEFEFGQDVTVPLFTALHSYSESILILLQNGGLFEADILLRCTMEGTVKYCYLMTGSEEQRRVKYNEYKYIIPEIDRLHDHRKAKESISILKEFSNNNTKPFETMLVSDEEATKINGNYPKRQKDELKRKWSYQALLRDLARNGTEYEAQLGSLSTYAITSHYCHLDYTGVSDLKQQYSSSSDDLLMFNYAHSLRIIANIISFYIFRVLEYMRCNNFFPENVRALCLEAVNFECEVNEELNHIISNKL